MRDLAKSKGGRGLLGESVVVARLFRGVGGRSVSPMTWIEFRIKLYEADGFSSGLEMYHL